MFCTTDTYMFTHILSINCSKTEQGLNQIDIMYVYRVSIIDVIYVNEINLYAYRKAD